MKPGRTANRGTGTVTAAPDKPGLASRQVAVKLLAAIVDRATPLDGLVDPLNGNRAYRNLTQADQALVRAMLLAALRHLTVIEAFLAGLVDRPLPEGARPLKHVLTIAAVQILYLDTPDHAAVDLAVEQARQDPRNRRFAPLVNAVLRRMSREKSRRLPELEATTANAPKWFADRLRKAYGDTADAILRSHAVPPALDITVKSDPEMWAKRLGGTVLPTGSVRLTEFDGPVTGLPGFEEGDWWVQDAAASIPARLFGDVRGQRIADLCAAPGGKTAQLAAAGAAVTAVDLSANRLKRLAENMRRLRLEVDIIQADLMEWQPQGDFDGVLLDAPCSATGTVRRHPDIPWTKGPHDIAKLAALQGRMLRRAFTLVRPGGIVVYANCSLDPMEGEQLIDGVLLECDHVHRCPVDGSRWPGLETMINAHGDVRTTPAMLPHADPTRSGLDGFFASVLVVKDET